MHELKSKNRQWLWHGTHPNNVPKILANGFSMGFAMTQLGNKSNGRSQANFFGVGIYFAKHAHYSMADVYAVSSKIGDGVSEKVLLLNRVTLGDSCVGDSTMLMPAYKKDATGKDSPIMYDSMRDQNESIFVLSCGGDRQAYPEFVVRFRN